MFTEKLTKAHESPGKAVKHCGRVTVQMRSYWFRREKEDQKVAEDTRDTEITSLFTLSFFFFEKLNFKLQKTIKTEKRVRRGFERKG